MGAGREERNHHNDACETGSRAGSIHMVLAHLGGPTICGGATPAMTAPMLASAMFR